eukprot:201401-Pyramimonas_sp.AAC.2
MFLGKAGPPPLESAIRALLIISMLLLEGLDHHESPYLPAPGAVDRGGKVPQPPWIRSTFDRSTASWIAQGSRWIVARARKMRRLRPPEPSDGGLVEPSEGDLEPSEGDTFATVETNSYHHTFRRPAAPAARMEKLNSPVGNGLVNG